MDATQRLAADKAVEGFHAKGELAEGQGTLAAKASMPEAGRANASNIP